MHLKGEDLLLPRIPKTETPPAASMGALKQLWTKFARFPPAGTRRKHSSSKRSINFKKADRSSTKAKGVSLVNESSNFMVSSRSPFVPFPFERQHSFQEVCLELTVVQAAIFTL
jgi:hypothetical protein